MPVVVQAQFTGNDNFDDNTVDSQLWEPLTALGSGVLSEVNERLEFTSNGSGTSYQYYKWADASYDEDFQLILRTANIMNANDANEFAAVGIEIYAAGSITTRLSVRHGAYNVFGFGGSRDILASFFINLTSVPSLPEQPLTVFPKSAMLRVVFDSSSKVFTVYYDDNPTDGTQWTQLSTFGVDSNANGEHNFNFGMSTGQLFGVYLYARTDQIGADPGEMIMDDFQASMGEPSAPSPAIDDGVEVEFTTELGKSYEVLKSSDLEGNSPFQLVDVVESDGVYRVVSQGEGDSLITGTGNVLKLVDSTEGSDAAFYKIQAK
ncbi:MAG: hypothetical protein AAGH40_08915 [Verrucomicrobiota bacterium]